MQKESEGPLRSPASGGFDVGPHTLGSGYCDSNVRFVRQWIDLSRSLLRLIQQVPCFDCMNQSDARIVVSLSEIPVQ